MTFDHKAPADSLPPQSHYLRAMRQPCRYRTFPARYVRSLVPPVAVQAVPGGVGLALDLSALLTRLAMREGLKEAGVRPGGV